MTYGSATTASAEEQYTQTYIIKWLVNAMVSRVNRKLCSRATGYELRRCCYCSSNIWILSLLIHSIGPVLSSHSTPSSRSAKYNSTTQKWTFWDLNDEISLNLALFTYAPQPLSIIRLRRKMDLQVNTILEQRKAIGPWGGSMDIIIAFACSHLKKHCGGNFEHVSNR